MPYSSWVARAPSETQAALAAGTGRLPSGHQQAAYAGLRREPERFPVVGEKMILEISGDFEPQMSTNSELPRGAAEQGVDFDVALLSRLLDGVEAFARRKDRASFRSRPQVTRERSGSASNTQLM